MGGEYETLPTQKTWVHLAAGSVAGLAEHCVMFPFDVVKTRLQSLRPCPETNCPTAMHCVMSMARREGWLGSYRGVKAMVAGAVPAHACYFTVYEKLVDKFRKGLEIFFLFFSNICFLFIFC